MILEASLAISVSEKHEISILFKKFSLDVFIYSPESSDLSEKAIAWTTKSKFSHVFLISLNVFITSSFFSTSQLRVKLDFNDSAKGTTLFLRASPKYVKASSAPCSDNYLAIPHAIDRSFATPIIKPFFPFNKLIY